MNGPLRAAARIAVVAGAVGSVGLMLREGLRTPPLLLVIFVLWVLSPFMIIAWADLPARRWSDGTRVALRWVTILIALVSLAVYGGVVSMPARAAHAAKFVIVAPASWLLLAIVIGVSAVTERRVLYPTEKKEKHT